MNIENREILSRQFIEDVKNLAAEKFKVKRIELVGSYRRNEATEESDVDFLILDDEAPYGLEYLKMIAFLEDHLGKEVGLLHKDSMTRERDKAIIESMMYDIEKYEQNRHSHDSVSFYLYRFSVTNLWQIDTTQLYICDLYRSKINEKSQLQSYN